MTLQTALVLQAIACGHNYGFDIMDHTGLPDGSIYPILRRLHEADLVTGEWEDARSAHLTGRPARKYYMLTDAGNEALARASKRFRVLDAMGDLEASKAYRLR